jgi:hypothetical protein
VSQRGKAVIAAHRVAPGTLLAFAVSVHLIASAALYAYLVRALYAMLTDTPRLIVLERGLVRILGASIFLPPVAPSVLLIATALWVGGERRVPIVGRLLSMAALVLAADSALRLIGVLLAAPASTVGELIDLPARYSPGPRMVAAVFGVDVTGNALVYWSVVCSAAALTSVVLAGRALVECDLARLDPVERRRRVARGDPLALAQALACTSVAFVAIAGVGEIALPLVTQLFLRIFG